MTTASASGASPRTARRRTPVQVVALVVGVVFLLVGIAGFVPGLTTSYDGMAMAGMGSTAMLLGVFQVSTLHNLVHLAFGVVGVAASARARASRLYLIIGGVVYGLLWIYGLAIDPESPANFVPLNSADNWLHLVLAVGMILLGALVPGVRRADPVTAP
jgi:4-hydroxybenzoate polyprenyltransferase